MTLKKLIENTTDVSNLSWTTQWITFIAGWWRFSLRATPTLSANTRTPRPRGIAKIAARNVSAAGSWAAAARSVCAVVLILALIAGSAPESLAQSSRKKKKVKKPAPVPCRVGCRPDTAAPGVREDTPEDQALRKELSGLARGVHNGALGAYNQLSAFAAKNAANVWGWRAALALGYVDNSQKHYQQALVLFNKASGATVLLEYILYWMAQAKHG